VGGGDLQSTISLNNSRIYTINSWKGFPNVRPAPLGPIAIF